MLTIEFKLTELQCSTSAIHYSS